MVAIELDYSIWMVPQLLLIRQPIESVGFQLMKLARTHRVSPRCGADAIVDSKGGIRIRVEGVKIRHPQGVGRGLNLLWSTLSHAQMHAPARVSPAPLSSIF